MEHVQNKKDPAAGGALFKDYKVYSKKLPQGKCAY